jgi:hypothetical protein
MVSYVHELLVLLFRNRSDAAADLLHGLDVPLPDYDRVSIGTTDVNDLQPAEYRDDLVLFLEQKQQKTLGIIVEVQLQPDAESRRHATGKSGYRSPSTHSGPSVWRLYGKAVQERKASGCRRRVEARAHLALPR